MRRLFLRSFGPQGEAWPEPPKRKAEDSHGGPPRSRTGLDLCFRCGRPLYKNNKSHMCYRCQRKWGLPTLRRRNKPLQAWHLSFCQNKNCEDPAHFADRIPVHPRIPRCPSRSKAQAEGLLPPVLHSVLLDGVTALRLKFNADAMSAERG